MSMYVQAHIKRACMWTREHMYVLARTGAKNDWSVCLCIYPSIRYSVGMYLNIYMSECCSLPLVQYQRVRPSICLSACMHVYVKVCMSNHLFFCPPFYMHP